MGARPETRCSTPDYVKPQRAVEIPPLDPTLTPVPDRVPPVLQSSVVEFGSPFPLLNVDTGERC